MSKLIRYTLNLISFLLIISTFVSVLPDIFYSGFINIDWDKTGSQLSIFVGAAAIVTINETAQRKIINKKKFLRYPNEFIDRVSHIKEIIRIILQNQNSIINVYGVSGIGITRLFEFLADLVNKKLAIFKRLKYITILDDNLLRKFICTYIDTSLVTTYESLLKEILNSNFVDKNIQSESVSISYLMNIINKKIRLKRIVFLFDGIIHDEQLKLIEKFIREFYQYRSKGYFLIGSTRKKNSYELNYNHLEILKFNKEELMSLAEVYNTKLKFDDTVKIYEMTDGIPLYAYLVIKNYRNTQEIVDVELAGYMKNKIIPQIGIDELILLEKISLLSFSKKSFSLKFLEQFCGKVDLDMLNHLSSQALIRYDKNSKTITLAEYIVKLVISQALNNDELLNYIDKLVNYYKNINEPTFSMMYLLLSRKINTDQKNFFNESLAKLIENHELLSLINVLSPAIDYKVNVKENLKQIYFPYCYAVIFLFMSCGQYTEAEIFINQLIVDGKLIKRYDNLLTKEEFDFHFLWSDLEHLLNNYSRSIEIIDQLVIQAKHKKKYSYLPKFYWLKAHCQRHMWKNPEQSLDSYQKCEKLSINYKNTEYLIRSIHGQILINFIKNDKMFDFEKQFFKLDTIYKENPDKFKQYFYNTLKYKGIYEREQGNLKEAQDYLNDALNGFEKLRRRNAYDLRFELAETYRKKILVINDEESKQETYDRCKNYYEESIVFSQENSDYNLNSLAQMGLILLKIQEDTFSISQIIDKLIEIEINCLKKDLHLNSRYASMIIQSLRAGDKQQINNIEFLSLFNP